MLNIDSLKLGPIPKVFLILVPWGVALLIGGFIHQNMGNPTPAKFLLVWATVTLVGLVGHALGLCRGLEWNFVVWVVAISLAWAFTFFVFQVYEPKGASDPILYSDLGAVWLGLMGIAFIFTAFQVSPLFWLIAIPHLVIALGMELSARSVIKIDYLDANQPLLVALVDGGLTLIAGIVGVILATRQSAK